MKMTMVPEATFNERIWTLLQEIRQQHLLIGDTTPIILSFDHRELGGTMKDHIDLLAQMRKWKIIRIAGDGTFDENNVQALAQVKVCNPLFDRVYALYEQGHLRQTEPKKLFEIFNDLVKFEYKNIKPAIKKFLEGKDGVQNQSVLAVGEIEYNPVTGIGYHGSKEFTLTDGSAEHRMFSKLYEKINTRISRYEVLELIRFYEDGEDSDPTRSTAETAAINKVAKGLRKKIGLTPAQLVLNAGNLTVIATKPTKPTPN